LTKFLIGPCDDQQWADQTFSVPGNEEYKGNLPVPGCQDAKMML